MTQISGKKKQSGFTKIRKDWIEPILIALILAALIRTFVIQPFKIPSGSMEDTLLVGDQLIAAKFLYGTKVPFTSKRILKIRSPKPGDIIVFKFPEDQSKDFIKRCVAVECQTIEIKNKQVYVDGVLQYLPGKAKSIDSTIYPSHIGPRDNYAPFVVPEGHVFVMGDNRSHSSDSRDWGYVVKENVVGKAWVRYWPPAVAGLIPKIAW